MGLRSALSAVGHFLIAAVVTTPIFWAGQDKLIGSPDVDVWNHAWGPWWWYDSISRGVLPWRTDLLGYPHGGVLWFIDPVLALFAAPLVPLFGPASAYNALVFGYVALASWAASRLAVSLGVEGWPKWVASTAFAGSAWVVCEVHNGITEAFNIGFVALAIAWVETASRAPTYRRWCVAGAGVGLATVASPYLGLGAALYAGFRGIPAIRRAWSGACVAVLLSAPPALALRTQLHSTDAIVRHPDTMNDQLALHNAVDPRTFLAPFGFRSVDLSAEGFEHSMYLGLFTVLLATYGLMTRIRAARRRAARFRDIPELWVAGAALGTLIFSLGPYLYWNGSWASLGTARLRMPWWLVQQLAPGLAVTHPLRLAVPALAVFAGAAAVGAARISGRPAALLIAMLVLLDGLVLSGAPWPIDTAPATTPAALLSFARVDDEPVGDAAVLNLPTDVGATMTTSRYLFWQTAHGRPITYGPDARASTSPLIHDATFRTLAAASSRRGDEASRLQLGGPADRTALGSLREIGVRWIAVHHDLDEAAGDRLQDIISAELGTGITHEQTSIWDLGPPPPRAERRGLARPETTTPGLGPSPQRPPAPPEATQ